MVKSKPKQENREDTTRGIYQLTTEEFVKKMNKQENKRNGIRRKTGQHHR